MCASTELYIVKKLHFCIQIWYDNGFRGHEIISCSASFTHWGWVLYICASKICRLLGAKPLSEPVMAYCYLNQWEHISKWQPFCLGLNVLNNRNIMLIICPTNTFEIPNECNLTLFRVQMQCILNILMQLITGLKWRFIGTNPMISNKMCQNVIGCPPNEIASQDIKNTLCCQLSSKFPQWWIFSRECAQK